MSDNNSHLEFVCPNCGSICFGIAGGVLHCHDCTNFRPIDPDKAYTACNFSCKALDRWKYYRWVDGKGIEDTSKPRPNSERDLLLFERRKYEPKVDIQAVLSLFYRLRSKAAVAAGYVKEEWNSLESFLDGLK